MTRPIIDDDKMTNGEYVINTVISVLIGWLLFTLLLFPYGLYITLLVSKNYIPQYALEIGNGVMFAITGVVVGVLCKRKTSIASIFTFFAIYATLLFQSKDSSFIKYINLSTAISLVSIIVGSFIGNKVKLLWAKRKLEQKLGARRQADLSEKETTGKKQLINIISTVFAGWLLFCLLTIPIAVAAKHHVSAYLIYIYTCAMFIIVGIAIRILSKDRMTVILIATCCAILVTVVLVGNSRSIESFFDLTAILSFVSIVVGSLIGARIKLYRMHKRKLQ